MRFWIAPHLAFLVQWLRILGLDILIWEKESVLREAGEAVVQWDRYPLPLERTRVPRITLSARGRVALLKEFFQLTGVQPERSGMFKRCLRCNTLLIPLEPEDARKKWPDLPPYVFQTQKRFNWCNVCRQLFWAGTHVQNMIRALEDWGIIIKETAPQDSLITP